MNEASTQTVRIGVIGCGAIAEMYHLPALSAHPQTAGGIALAEPNRTRLEDLQQKFQAAHAVDDYRDLLGKVDGVIVATPPQLHYPMTKFFLEQGVHVLSEKPLTESLAEARELVEISQHIGAKLAVNQTRRFFPTYQKIRELIATGELGTLESITYHDGIEFDWPAASPHHFQANAKGAWSDTGVHLLDTVCYWLNTRPQLVESLNDSYQGPEAMATVRLAHESCSVEIKVSRLGRLKNGFQIVGSLGSIEAGAEDWDEITIQYADGRRRCISCGSNRLTYTDFAKPMLQDFVQVIADGAEPYVSGESTLSTIELLESAYRTSKPYSMPWNNHLGTSYLDDQPAIQLRTPLRVLVTGAAGFLGGRLVETLELTNLATPVAAIRKWSRAPRIARHAANIVICDILDPQQVEAATKHVDAIVHCAYADDRNSIVEGTGNLLKAAVKNQVQKFVYLSSGEVYAPTLAGNVNEQEELTPTGRLYGDAKLAAEQLCREYHSQGVPATILRPSLIYGPFSSSWSMNIAKRLQSGNWGLFDDLGDGIANLVYVDDLVQAILLSLFDTRAAGETFNVNGPTQPTWNEYFQQFNQALGLSPLQHISVSKSRWKTRAMDAFGSIADRILDRFEDQLMEIYLRGGWASRVMKRMKGELDSTPTGEELNDLYSRQAVYDDKKIRDLLNYQPRFSLEEGIAATIQWLALHELTPSLPSRSAAGFTIEETSPETKAVLT